MAQSSAERAAAGRRPPTAAKLRAPAQRVATDPRPARNGLCVVAGCDRPRTPIAVANEDPFCSTDCCRTWYEAAR